jgi:hypothetical protein
LKISDYLIHRFAVPLPQRGRLKISDHLIHRFAVPFPQRGRLKINIVFYTSDRFNECCIV